MTDITDKTNSSAPETDQVPIGEELPNKKGIHLGDLNSGSPPPSAKPKTPPLDFTTYIMSLGQTVQVALGTQPSPDENAETFVNRDVARQFIDILILLQEKTAGNLTTDEKNLLDALCYELKLQYISSATSSASSSTR